MPILGIGAVIWALCAIHVVRTGRPYYWIAIISVPVIGPLAYFLLEMLPDLRRDPSVHRATSKVMKSFDPERQKRYLAERLEAADTPANRLALARECLELGDFANASDLFSSCLAGVYRDDPAILLGFAQARFGLRDYGNTLKVLDDLIAAHPDFRSHEGHFLYAKALEALGRQDDALREYAALVQGYPGEEARVRYGQLLKAAGRAGEARGVFETVLNRTRVAPAYYRREQQAWIEAAKRELAG